MKYKDSRGNFNMMKDESISEIHKPLWIWKYVQREKNVDIDLWICKNLSKKKRTKKSPNATEMNEVDFIVLVK